MNEFLKDVSALADARRELVIISEKMNRAVQNEKSSTLTHNDILGIILCCCVFLFLFTLCFSGSLSNSLFAAHRSFLPLCLISLQFIYCEIQ